MGVDIKSLSPKAQKQVYEKLLMEQKSKAGAKLAADKGKLMSEDEDSPKGSKYGSKKVEINGIRFDSKKEARRYLQLSAMELAGQIQDLRLQVKYELIPAQRIDGKVVEKNCSYVADFVYEQDGKTVVEDVKGYKQSTAYAVFAIKRKLMLWIHGIRVTEV